MLYNALANWSDATHLGPNPMFNHTQRAYLCSMVLSSICILFVQCAPMPTHEPLEQPDAAYLESLFQENLRNSPEGSLKDIRAHNNPDSSVRLSLSASLPLAYILRWDWTGARWDAESQSHVFQNKLGYTVGLRTGYIGTIAMQMVACKDPEPIPDKWGWLPFRWGVREVKADHSFTEDTSIASRLIIEVWKAPDTLFGLGKSSGRAYCKLHVLYAALTQKAPDGREIKRSSIVLHGWVQYPGKSERKEWRASTSLAGGSLLPLTTPTQKLPSFHPTQWGAYASVILVRRPVQAFAHVDFAQMEPIELAYHVLHRLSGATSAYVVMDD